jgi:hypothetical protein
MWYWWQWLCQCNTFANADVNDNDYADADSEFFSWWRTWLSLGITRYRVTDTNLAITSVVNCLNEILADAKDGSQGNQYQLRNSMVTNVWLSFSLANGNQVLANGNRVLADGIETSLPSPARLTQVTSMFKLFASNITVQSESKKSTEVWCYSSRIFIPIKIFKIFLKIIWIYFKVYKISKIQNVNLTNPVCYFSQL